jgi:hypothetical protein
VGGGCEVAGFEEVQLGVGQILQVGLRTLGREEAVVLAPWQQRRRLLGAQLVVPARIERHGGLPSVLGWRLNQRLGMPAR